MGTKNEARAYQAAYYQEHREDVLARSAAYYWDHRADVLARQNAYNAAHKEERRVNGAAYYQENRDALLKKFKRERDEFTEWLQILRTNNGCEDCGTHEGWLEHHHVDPETKLYNVGDMYSHSLDVLENELEKCVVLCRSCHKKRHVEMRAATC